MPSCTSCTLVSPLAGFTSLSYPSLHWHIGCTGCTMLSYPLPCGGARLSHYAMPLRCSATVLNHYIMPLRCYATSGSVLCHYGSLPVAVAAADGQRPHALLRPMLHLHRLHSVPCYTYIDCSSTQALLTLTAVQPKVTLYIDCSSTHVTLTLTAVQLKLHGGPLHQRHVPGTRCRTVQATHCQCTVGASSTTSSQAGQITGTPAPSQGGERTDEHVGL